jgi:hypothetical protein
MHQIGSKYINRHLSNIPAELEQNLEGSNIIWNTKLKKVILKYEIRKIKRIKPVRFWIYYIASLWYFFYSCICKKIEEVVGQFDQHNALSMTSRRKMSWHINISLIFISVIVILLSEVSNITSHYHYHYAVHFTIQSISK